ncbi:hypothetical protein [Ralstonia mannitolilytica]|uniref:Uncharacterized protein n=2 Tax=Pseudomonadota TaxID=1224 RepID=A0AAJ5D634_9RALS|nr:hypothetical protein [Ralstonia mannitolilytica]CAG2130868.1 hypothetical protein LMG6866_00476 [Ralstonia mannitolilytica]SUE24725.1 Uncharacterised protein [Ralstonia mannitolilytica]SUE25369.1 Uncharacterised protein [Ralstonia mannitolilytica]SUE35179.1 Uncharacterised protein [Ralstonia mannitolilytica]
MFDSPLEGEFTQGTVFSCAHAENYPIAGVLGLVITARCDAAQDKVPVFSYVPVVSISRWMMHDGALIVLERIEADLINTFANNLRDFSLSDSLIKSHEMSVIYDVHLRKYEDDRGKKSKCEKIKGVIDSLEECRYIKSNPKEVDRLTCLLRKFDEKVTSVVRDLTDNKLSGYYLLRDLTSLNDEDGTDFVALLREVHHVATPIAKKIAHGLHREAVATAHVVCPAFYGNDELSMPIAKLRSPWIEHLMQNFTLLFSRIGVKNNNYMEVKRSLYKIGIGG